jgi:hypothetical protein
VLRRRKDDRRKQALLIAAWTDVDDTEMNEETGEGVRCFVREVNRSDLPVTNVIVRCAPRLGEDAEPWVQRLHALGPGQEVRQLVAVTDAHDALGYPGEVLSLSFVDHANRLWVRDASGLNERPSQRRGWRTTPNEPFDG